MNKFFKYLIKKGILAEICLYPNGGNNKNRKIKILVMVRIKERIIDVDEILNKLEPEQREAVQNLRALIKSTVPETVELVKQQNITFKLDNKDFVWISHYQGHVDLEFSMGSSLDSDLLKSRGEQKSENVRHIKVNNFEKLKPEISRLLKAAAAIGFEHCPSPP